MFDGYGNNPSTKDHEHLRRAMKSTGCPDVQVQLHIQTQFPQHTFLLNNQNKMQLIDLLAQHLQADGYTTQRSNDDADTMIVSAAIDVAGRGESVTVFANDTDVIIIFYTFGTVIWEP